MFKIRYLESGKSKVDALGSRVSALGSRLDKLQCRDRMSKQLTGSLGKMQRQRRRASNSPEARADDRKQLTASSRNCGVGSADRRNFNLQARRSQNNRTRHTGGKLEKKRGGEKSRAHCQWAGLQPEGPNQACPVRQCGPNLESRNRVDSAIQRFWARSRPDSADCDSAHRIGIV
ncbi:hypothetical protein CRG98_020850 [Punica granatum]|uniref:Uncharacterized protein n=1 Tax=Punica granatum TaxID=22663 RepID=A0A2I0JTH7_PUNGR|nr:hypothetical protein CRG98_020850 [Punica granatum]